MARRRSARPAHRPLVLRGGRPDGADGDARPRADALRGGEQGGLRSPAAPMGCRAWRSGRCSALFEFDLFGRTAYLYSLAVLFVLFLLARLIVPRPSACRCAASAAIRAARGARRAGAGAARRGLRSRRPMPGRPGALLAQTTQFVSLDALSFQRSRGPAADAGPRRAGSLYGAILGAAPSRCASRARELQPAILAVLARASRSSLLRARRARGGPWRHAVVAADCAGGGKPR
jgi:hypothetical protein